MFWADTVGADYINSRLKKWAEVYGGFFKPASYLEERAKKGLPLVLNLVILWSNPSFLHYDFFLFPTLFWRANQLAGILIILIVLRFDVFVLKHTFQLEMIWLHTEAFSLILLH